MTTDSDNSVYSHASPEPKEVLVSDKQLSELLRRDFGISLSPRTLKNLRWSAASDGPPFVKWRGRVYYPLEASLSWVRAQRSPVVRTTRQLEEGTQAPEGGTV